jgi:tetratricopeptide (TPR) repeat protein
MSNQSEEGLKQAHEMLEKGRPDEAKRILANILEFNLGNSEIDFTIWSCSFWIDFLKQLSHLDSYEQGESLFFHWKSFEEALCKKKEIYRRTVFAVQTGVFTLALNSYSSVNADSLKLPAQKADLLLKTGICNKKLGKYDVARSIFLEANKVLPGSARIIAEMADCCALCGMENEAKVLFREAFFIDAKKIDINLLDSELIKCLIQRVKDEHTSLEPEIQFWVPVYAVLYGVFNIKRELRSVEVLKLKQDIYELESEIKNPANNIKQLKPKLIYMYFRLVDHYVQKNQTGSELSDILLKIKILDGDIYRDYIK